MGAPKGNDYAVGNEGGRPPIFSEDEEGIEALDNLCIKYFEELPNTKPPTVTGLTLAIGFSAKSTLYEYAKKEVFSNSIKKALTKIEQFHEEATAMGDKCTGNIFVLKNFGWHDTVRTEHSGYITPEKPLTPEEAKAKLKELHNK